MLVQIFFFLELRKVGNKHLIFYLLIKTKDKKYVAYKMKQEDKLIDLRKIEEGQKREIKALEKLSGRYLFAIKELLKLKSGKELTKDMVEAFISKIYVYPGKRIEVLFTFTADCMEGGEIMECLAMYLRLSIEDEGDKDESNSISNQRKQIYEYIHHDSELSRYAVVEFCDDGYSGTNMGRLGMQKMLKEIKANKIQCIIVKDMSHF